MTEAVFDLDAFLSGMDNDTENDEEETKENSDIDDDNWADVASKVENSDNEDDLQLSDVGINLKNLHKDPIFPEELCRSLRDHVEALTCENARLNRQLEEAELKARSAASSASSPLRGLGRSSDLAANKIVELSKKVRELNAELAVAQTRASTAEAKLRKRLPAPEPPVKKTDEKDAQDEVKELTEKLNSTNIKLCEARNQVQQLKHALKITHKALASELGEGVPVQSALAPGWRGRAQHIIALQQKLNEMNEKLSQTNIAGYERANLSAQIAQRQAEKERQAEHQKEVEGLRSELEDSKKKLDATKARIRVITSEMAILKTKVSTLQDKSNHDDQLISALTGQLSSATEKWKDREQHVASGLEEQLSTIRKELAQEKTRTAQLHNIITEKDTIISRLEEKLNSSNPVHPDPALSERSFSRSSYDRNSIVSTALHQDVLSSTTEAERLRLMELLTITNRRLDDERLALDRTQEQLRQERQKCARLETKLGRLELERVGSAGCRHSGYRKNQARTSASSQGVSPSEWETLKNKAELLEEKCLALETRLTCLRQEKEEDCRKYINLIEETRHSFSAI